MKYIGQKDIDCSVGAVLQVAEFVWLRVFLENENKGGVVEKKYNHARRKFEYSCLISNKSADVVNEFLSNYKITV